MEQNVFFKDPTFQHVDRPKSVATRQGAELRLTARTFSLPAVAARRQQMEAITAINIFHDRLDDHPSRRVRAPSKPGCHDHDFVVTSNLSLARGDKMRLP